MRKQEWLDEEDHYEFTTRGLRCEIKRHSLRGHLCGYIIMESPHPWFPDGDFWGLAECSTEVHGGITYFNKLSDNEIEIGFDCSHRFDFVPYDDHLISHANSTGEEVCPPYRNVEYVRQELLKLAEEIVKARVSTTSKEGI